MEPSAYVRQRLRCPICGSRVVFHDGCHCTGSACGQRFPVVEGVAVLINEGRSVYTFADFVERKPTFFDPAVDPKGWRAQLANLLYENSIDVKGTSIIRRLSELLKTISDSPRVLVIGSGMGEDGLDLLQSTANAELVRTDVFAGREVAFICDAHDLPFDDETFDCVVAQAVLEHVIDPQRCVDEVHRVLRAGGLFFSDTPFMQQVHGGRYDFTRFTHAGQRRLFRRFEEIESGASSGPGLALTWAYRYFLLSFAATPATTRLLRVLAKLTSFWWKYFDRILIDRPAALDAACAIYFIGRRNEAVLSDRAVVSSYRGANG